MYPCPTVSSESNNKKKVFTSREYCHRGQIVACRGLATVAVEGGVIPRNLPVLR
jgi:hypothetical protein